MIERDHSNFVQKLQERSGASGRQPQRFGAATGPGQDLSATTRSGAAQPGAAQPRDAATPPGRTQPGQLDQPARTVTTQDRDQTAAGQALRSALGQERGQRITVARPAIGNQPGSEILQLHHEVAEKCLESARQEAQKLGAEFDKHFLGAQIVAHKGMLDKLQVFGQHVSPQTQQLLTQAQETTRKHLEHAKQLHEQLSKEGGAAGARERPRTTTETTKDRD
jgi:hypothetical protein